MALRTGSPPLAEPGAPATPPAAPRSTAGEGSRTGSAAALEARWSAHNYEPLPVTLVAGEGAWVTDETGAPYLDLLAGYSALNFGHRHPRLLAAAHAQLERLTLTSRAFHNDQLGPFCEELAGLLQMECVLPMNTGAEAVETAIKAARRWAYEVKGVPADQAVVVTFAGNFHGRTTTIVGFSTDPDARDGFGPFPQGFRTAPYGDLEAAAAAIDERTAAVLVEPVQGEAGVVVPPPGYLGGLRALCDRHGVLLVTDEIQSGLGRTGRTLAADHEGVVADLVLVGKALGGGILPISAVVGRGGVLERFTPGSHGSTFGGNPLACAVGREVVAMLATGGPQRRAAELGEVLGEELARLDPARVTAVRRLGLWAGIDLVGGDRAGREVAEALASRGVLVKEAHGHTLRIAPPFVVTEEELRWAMAQLRATLADR